MLEAICHEMVFENTLEPLAKPCLKNLRGGFKASDGVSSQQLAEPEQ